MAGIYEALDRAVGGWLPGGVSPAELAGEQRTGVRVASTPAVSSQLAGGAKIVTVIYRVVNGQNIPIAVRKGRPALMSVDFATYRKVGRMLRRFVKRAGIRRPRYYGVKGRR